MEQWVFILSVIGSILSGLVAFLHLYFMILETFLWRKFAGRLFKLKEEVVDATSSMAANQGVYNGVLAAGLIWGISIQDSKILYFFLLNIVGVGIFGGLTASPRIFLFQPLPALVALIFVGITMLAQDIDIALVVVTALVVVVFALFGIYVRIREQTNTKENDNTNISLFDQEQVVSPSYQSNQ
jgi:putative membrane protein